MLRRLAISACRSAAPALGAVAKPSASAWGSLAGAGMGSHGLSTVRGCGALGARGAAAGAWETGSFARRGLSGGSATPGDTSAARRRGRRQGVERGGVGGEDAEAPARARWPPGFGKSGMKKADVQYYVPGWGDSRKGKKHKRLMKQKQAFVKVRTRPRHAASPSIPRVRIHLPG
jgi:hypothetical protein